MPISKNQLQAIQQHIGPKGCNCGACGSRGFQTTGIISAPAWNNGTTVLGGQTVPMVQLVCNNCGAVSLFAAMSIPGLV